jgi:hypothetical protein
MGAWQLACATANDRGLDGGSLGTSAGRLDLDHRSLAVNGGSASKSILPGKGIDLLDVWIGAFVDLCIGRAATKTS